MSMIKEIAQQLNGIEYDRHTHDHVRKIGKVHEQAGVVIVYGESDDLMEFAGAISEELGGTNNGITAYVTRDGLLQNDCKNSDCPHFEKAKASAATIEALWCKEDGYSWTFRTEIPHETFDIVEDGEKFCRGIVFTLDSVKP